MTATLAAAPAATALRPPTASRLGSVEAPVMAEPEGLRAWRQTAASAQGDQITAEQAMTVLSRTRAGAARADVAAAARLDVVQVLDVVAGVGGRIGQANKTGPRAANCLSTSRGARLGLTPGVHVLDDDVVVVLAAGWGRTRKEPRDVSRSYAAVVLSDPAMDRHSVERWLSNTTATAEVTYQHLAHLYGVATGAFATLEGISADPQVQAAYLEGYSTLAGAIRRARHQLRVVLNPTSTPEQVFDAARGSFWLLGSFARPIAAAARACEQGHPQAPAALRTAVSRLRTAVDRSPRAFFPAGLGSLSRSQFRAICAQAGHPVPMDDDGTGDGTGERALLAALASARREQLSLAS